MTPVQNSISPFKIDGTAPRAGSVPPGAASATQSTNSTRASGSNDEVRPAWYRRTNPGPPVEPPREGEKQDPFFAVIDKLIDQLDAMIGQLLGGATPGTGTTTAPGTGTPTVPGNGATTTPGTGTTTTLGSGTTTTLGTGATAGSNPAVPGEGGGTAAFGAVAATAMPGTGARTSTLNTGAGAGNLGAVASITTPGTGDAMLSRLQISPEISLA